MAQPVRLFLERPLRAVCRPQLRLEMQLCCTTPRPKILTGSNGKFAWETTCSNLDKASNIASFGAQKAH
jgi:hypothetical protein